MTFIMKGEPFFRQFGVSSALRSKALAQGRFIRPEQVQSPKGERPKARTQQKSHDPWVVALLLVDDNGFEPLTLRTSSGCSSQLS